MDEAIVRLTDAELARLVDGLLQGTIPPTPSSLQLTRAGLPHQADLISAWLPSALGQFNTIAALVAGLRMVQADRHQSSRISTSPDIVITGPMLHGDSNRDTRVVIREILESARHSVLIVGYAFYGSAMIFEPLARQMGRNAAFQTRIVLNIHQIPGQPPARSIVQAAHRFTTAIWPFHPRPAVYYLPDSLAHDPGRRASVHAKLVIADSETVYIGSANFTTAAFRRNIEIGVRLQDSGLAQHLTEHFDLLVSGKYLLPLSLVEEEGSSS